MSRTMAWVGLPKRVVSRALSYLAVTPSVPAASPREEAKRRQGRQRQAAWLGDHRDAEADITRG